MISNSNLLEYLRIQDYSKNRVYRVKRIHRGEGRPVQRYFATDHDSINVAPSKRTLIKECCVAFDDHDSSIKDELINF